MVGVASASTQSDVGGATSKLLRSTLAEAASGSIANPNANAPTTTALGSIQPSGILVRFLSAQRGRRGAPREDVQGGTEPRVEFRPWRSSATEAMGTPL